MFIYIILLFFILLVTIKLVNGKLSEKSQLRLIYTLFGILLIMIAFRSELVGTDNIRHKDAFIFTKDLFFLDVSGSEFFFIEPLWRILFYVVNQSGFSVNIFWLVYFCFVWLFLLKSIPDNISKLLVVSIFILSYFYYSSYNISAQVLASTLILCSIKSLRKKSISSIIYIIIAIGIHKASLFVLPFFLLAFISINKKWYYLAFGLSFLILFLGIDSLLFAEVNNMMSIYDKSSAMSDYNVYFDMKNIGLNIYGIIMSYFIMLAYIGVFIILHSATNNKLDIYSQLWAIGIIINILTFNYAWLFRLSYFFMFSLIIVIPKMFTVCNKKQVILAIILLSMIYVCKLYNNNDGIVPYEMKCYL